MGRHSDKARGVLLDAAEELFARHGIDAVSNRRITEHAGTANHSAITYHFGNRDGLLEALLRRHVDEMNHRQTEAIARLGESPELWDVIACRFLPWIDHLAAQPIPSWRARFLFQVRSVPSVSAVVTGVLSAKDGNEVLAGHTSRILGQIPQAILTARSNILGPMVLGICADYERQVQEDTAEGSWTSLGYFLVDAIAGMLAAPVTHARDGGPPRTVPGLV